ncbi:MAG TPA: SRPBCC family protein, partial [Streptosporangiaceae bacterium]|nr:SRPBCC family protein [Streptosporangiaceae bacterium]
MELEHSFTVPVPPEQAWQVLLDVERIAPCMPGATVDSVDGDVVSGRIKVKVGPVTMTYSGTGRFTERDEQARSVTLEAAGKEIRGGGPAAAT